MRLYREVQLIRGCRHKSTPYNITLCILAYTYSRQFYNSPMLTLNIVIVCKGSRASHGSIYSPYCNSYIRLHAVYVNSNVTHVTRIV